MSILWIRLIAGIGVVAGTSLALGAGNALLNGIRILDDERGASLLRVPWQLSITFLLLGIFIVLASWTGSSWAVAWMGEEEDSEEDDPYQAESTGPGKKTG